MLERAFELEQHPFGNSDPRKHSVWRAFFLAVGAMLVILGAECLVIDSATLAAEQPAPVVPGQVWFNPEPMLDPNRVVRPPEWIPWSLLATGAVILLYARTLPQRFGGG
jgi:hypothetical protein